MRQVRGVIRESGQRPISKRTPPSKASFRYLDRSKVRFDSPSTRWNRSFTPAVIMPQPSKDGSMHAFLNIVCDAP